MKKQCTTSNNAIKLVAPIDCSTPVVVPTTGCIDPFTYTFNLAVANSINMDISVDEAFLSILGSGLIIPTGDAICCPDCIEAPFYSLTTAEGFGELGLALDWYTPSPLFKFCCVNIDADPLAYLKWNSQFGKIGISPDCCNTNFSKCINPLFTVDLLADGIVETNTLKGDTILCKIVELYNSISSPAYFDITVIEFFAKILSLGFVAFCCDCNMIISSTPKFIDYINGNGCKSLNIIIGKE